MLNRKRLNRAGAIHIPKIMRAEQGISRNTNLELVAIDNGDILIKKISPTCFICGSTNKQINICKKNICIDCAKKIIEIVGEENE